MAAGDLYQDPQATKKKPQGGNLADATTNGGNLADVGQPAPAPAQDVAAAPAPPLATSRPPSQTTPQPAQTPASSADPFTSIGGGVQLPTGEWVPNGHPLALQAQAAQPAAPTSLPPTPPTVPVPPRQPQGPQPADVIPPGVGTPETPIAPPKDAPPVAPPPPDPNTTAYKSALLKMLDQASTPATLEDPALKAQSDAYSLAQTRSRDRARSAMAERMSGEGGAGVNSGAFNNELAGLFQQQGEAEAGFNAGLVGDANKSKVQQLQAALTMMGNDVNSEQGRALTKELAQAQLAEGSKEFEMNFGLEGKKLAETIRQFDTSTEAGKAALAQQLEMFKQSQAQQGRQFDVDAALKKMGIQSQTDLGQADLRLRDKLGSGGLNAQILQMLMQNDQFGKSLGADLGKFNASQGSNYLSALLGQLGA